MINEWLEYLASSGASVDTDGNSCFHAGCTPDAAVLGPHSPLDEPLLVDMSRLGVVDVNGEDAREFLQAQVCNDLSQLDASGVQLNGYCNPKGRLYALFAVFEHADGYRLLLPRDVVEAFVRRMSMFVLRASVTIAAQHELVCTGYLQPHPVSANADAASAQFEAITRLAAAPLQVLHEAGSSTVRWHDVMRTDAGDNVTSVQRYIFIDSNASAQARWQQFQGARAGMPAWRWSEILAGQPSVFAATQEQFIPQMVNLQLIDGLSFKKGCYPGQEIVARMQYLGKLKRNMRLFRLPAVADAPLPGTAVVTPADSNAGQVVDAVADADGVLLLAVISKAASVAELSVAGHALRELALPYRLECENDDKRDSARAGQGSSSG